MNILFCGDENAQDGVLISTLSLIKNSGAQELHLYILTMEAHSDERKYHPFSQHAADFLRSLVTISRTNFPSVLYTNILGKKAKEAK